MGQKCFLSGVTRPHTQRNLGKVFCRSLYKSLFQIFKLGFHRHFCQNYGYGFFFNLIGSQREEGATRAGEEDRPREGGGRGEEGGAREGDARPSERTEEAAYGAGVGDGRADGPAPCGLRHPVKGERPPEEFLYFKYSIIFALNGKITVLIHIIDINMQFCILQLPFAS